MSIAGLVLAAGRAARFGTTKQLAEVDGRPLVRHVVDTARAAGLEPVHVVVGHDAEAVAAVLPDDATIVTNASHAAGQSTSVAAGLRSLASTEAAAVVVLLADEPTVTSGAIATVRDAHDHGAPVVRCRYSDRPGHPVLLAREVWPDAIAAADGDRGAVGLFDRGDAVEVALRTAAPTDVDTRDDLDGLRGPGSST